MISFHYYEAYVASYVMNALTNTDLSLCYFSTVFMYSELYQLSVKLFVHKIQYITHENNHLAPWGLFR